MATAQATSAEYNIPPSYTTNRRSALLWVSSHAVRQWPFLLLALTGAIANAALAGVVPVLIGQAFNVVMAAELDAARLIQIGLLVAGSQTLRAVLQFARNGSFEMVAQRLNATCEMNCTVAVGKA